MSGMERKDIAKELLVFGNYLDTENNIKEKEESRVTGIRLCYVCFSEADPS